MPGNINFSMFWSIVGRSVPPLLLSLCTLHFREKLRFVHMAKLVLELPLAASTQLPLLWPSPHCVWLGKYPESALPWPAAWTTHWLQWCKQKKRQVLV